LDAGTGYCATNRHPCPEVPERTDQDERAVGGDLESAQRAGPTFQGIEEPVVAGGRQIEGRGQFECGHTTGRLVGVPACEQVFFAWTE
jgi:hypothetical protein